MVTRGRHEPLPETLRRGPEYEDRGGPEDPCVGQPSPATGLAVAGHVAGRVRPCGHAYHDPPDVIVGGAGLLPTSTGGGLRGQGAGVEAHFSGAHRLTEGRGAAPQPDSRARRAASSRTVSSTVNATTTITADSTSAGPSSLSSAP